MPSLTQLKPERSAIVLKSSLAMLCVTAIALPFYATIAKQATNSWPALGFDASNWVAVYAVIAAIAGWITNSIVQIYNQVRQHTINVVLQARLSPIFVAKLDTFIRAYPDLPRSSNVEVGDWNDPKKLEALEAVKYLLNYYEFFALCIRLGHFDERVLYQMWRQVVNNLIRKTGIFIDYARSGYEVGSPNPRTYEHLLWLHERWNTGILENSYIRM